MQAQERGKVIQAIEGITTSFPPIGSLEKEALELSEAELIQSMKLLEDARSRFGPFNFTFGHGNDRSVFFAQPIKTANKITVGDSRTQISAEVEGELFVFLNRTGFYALGVPTAYRNTDIKSKGK